MDKSPDLAVAYNRTFISTNQNVFTEGDMK